ncbi:sigma-54-dependent transcriptional regulator [Haliangium ochraceum]|uniref:sigma-54-dependent transcriptional regulator n=1 Tax=Haliangium ochraceum TaxID=80816 RepID=UPI000BB4C7A2|nr:sigma-54 dependent transcriptional regulator [Haliangium ochraceum]
MNAQTQLSPAPLSAARSGGQGRAAGPALVVGNDGRGQQLWDPSKVVLVVDDESGIVDSLTKIFQREGLRVLGASDGAEGLELLRKHRVGVLLTDLMMPHTTGMDLLKAAKTVAPETEVVLMTAYGTVETAVQAMKEGAYDFVTKPLKRAHVVRIVKNALEKQSLVVENRVLRAQLAEQRSRAVIGSSLAWRRTMDIVHQAAPSDATVLLLGESGTGKELLARSLHEGSARADKPFIAINCAAIPESILEGELFGYEKGAFTGATSSREGRFEAASGGTLFLDEVGEMPRHVQVKLLRVLQEGEIERLGGSGRTRPIDIRLIAATNVELAKAVQEGRFREDLYYRLNVISIAVPPLRERRDDIPLLVQHFLQVYADKNGKFMAGCTQDALDRLCRYAWPGNVRELENAVERAVVLSRGEVLDEAALPFEVRSGEGALAEAAGAGDPGGALRFAVGTPLAEIEMAVIHETLRHTKGDKRLAAKLLGIATRTIYRRLEAEGDKGGDESGNDAVESIDSHRGGRGPSLPEGEP